MCKVDYCCKNYLMISALDIYHHSEGRIYIQNTTLGSKIYIRRELQILSWKFRKCPEKVKQAVKKLQLNSEQLVLWGWNVEKHVLSKENSRNQDPGSGEGEFCRNLSKLVLKQSHVLGVRIKFARLNYIKLAQNSQLWGNVSEKTKRDKQTRLK